MKKSAPKKTRSGAQMPWFAADGENLRAKLLCDHVEQLRTHDLQTYRSRVLENMRLYAGSCNVNGTSELLDEKFRYNIVKSCTDTAAAVLSAARTLPFCQTRGAAWDLRRKAMLRNQTLQTQFSDIGVFSQSQQVITDALVCGLGVIKFFEDADKPGGAASCQRNLPLSIVWDPAEAVSGTPRNIFEVALINRDVLMELYPEHAEAIAKAPGPSAKDSLDFQLTRFAKANQCVVVEGWHLPSSAEASDGFHMIAIPGVKLFSEEWKLPRFPFAFLRGWAPNMLGFTGVSIAELCRPAQQRIEEIREHVRKCQVLGSGPRVFLQNGSKVEPEQITNAPMQTHLYEGAAPVFYNFSATPVDLEQTVQQIREETLSMIGLSSQQVQGERPAGVTSAVGQRAAEDIQSKRHVQNLRFVETFYLDCAQALVDVNDSIAKDKPEFSIDRAVRQRWLETSKWADVSMEPGQAKMAVLPVSALVGSVSAQYDTVQEWVAAGWCDQTTAKMLAGHPDTEGETEQDSEDLLYSHYLIDKILDGEKVALDPFLSADVFATEGRTAYLKSKRDGAPEPVLNEFRRVLSIAKAAIVASQPAPVAAPAAEMDLPGAQAA